MDTAANSSQKWVFGVFEVDARAGQLLRGSRPVKMREQSFRILVFLLEHAGEIVTREDLRRILWPSDTYVDFDHSLNTAVMKLREVLGDSADAPLYIETIPRRGYRFVAPVTQTADLRNSQSNGSAAIALPLSRGARAEGADEIRPPVEQILPARDPLPRAREPGQRKGRLGVLAVAILLLIAAGASFFFLRPRRSEAPAYEGGQRPLPLRILPVTTAAGDADSPVFSPDGREVAFAWDGSEGRRSDIYVQILGTELPLRLTYSKRGVAGAPAWSPEGSEIAFIRCDGKNDSVYIVPALGGAERRLTGITCSYSLSGTLAWLPDGKHMLMMDRCQPAGTFGVVLFSLSTGEKACLTQPGPLKGADGADGFALSPDGQTIAYGSPTGSVCCDIFTIPSTGGPPKQLTADGKVYSDELMWTPDGKSIVFASGRTSLPSLWRVSIKGGPVEPEPIYPAVGSLSKDGRQLVYSERSRGELPAVWRADLGAPGGPVLTHRKLIGTHYPEVDAQPSPNGKRIVWMSGRAGFFELWTSDAKGGNPLPLTHLSSYAGTPRWSPDSQWIAFDLRTPHGVQIFIIDPEGRNLRAITAGPYDNVVPSWSRDGKTIYFASKRTGVWQVWRHAVNGAAESQFTRNGGFDAWESYDGRTVYFSRFYQAGIWSLPANGGIESQVVADRPQAGCWGHWAVTQAGLYFLDEEAEPKPNIQFQRFGSSHSSTVLTFEMKPLRQDPSLSATADGKTLYYTQYDEQSVLKLMEFSH